MSRPPHARVEPPTAYLDNWNMHHVLPTREWNRLLADVGHLAASPSCFTGPPTKSPPQAATEVALGRFISTRPPPGVGA